MKHHLLCAVLASLAVVPVWSAVKVGDTAPEIHLQAFVPEQPLPAALESLKGKSVVLEFWATWCGPCVDAIGHLNELADQFAGKPVQFLSMTDEDAATIEKFLKIKPIHGWVGIDRQKVMSKAYGFQGVPDTVLITPDGKVAAIMHPNHLTATHIEDLVAGRPVKAPVMPDFTLSRTGDDSTTPALFDFLIRQSTSGNGGMSTGPGQLKVKGYTLSSLLAQAYQMPAQFIVGEGADSPTRYDVSLMAPGTTHDAFDKLAQDALCAAFHVTAHKETRQVEGWVLKAPNGKPEALKETELHTGSAQSGNGAISMTGMAIKNLAGMVQGMVRKPVADQTGLTGRYDLKLKYDKDNPESILDVLRGLGFTLEPATLPTEFLVLTKQ